VIDEIIRTNETNAAALVERAESIMFKAQRFLFKFRFAQVEFLLNDACLLFEQAELLCPLQNRGLQDFKDTPPAKRTWIDFSRKPDDAIARLNGLAKQLGCNCAPVSCKCLPCYEERVQYKTQCWTCGVPLPLASDAYWLEEQRLWLCFICNDILFDILYPESSAATKISDLLNDTIWFAAPPAEYTPALERLNEAREWAALAKEFPHSVISPQDKQMAKR
jgi:hypothetical protein